VLLEHIAKGYIGERHDGALYVVGRVCEYATYHFQAGDIFLPNVGGGVMVPEEMRNAILDGTIANGRLVPFSMLEAPMRVMDEDVINAA